MHRHLGLMGFAGVRAHWKNVGCPLPSMVPCLEATGEVLDQMERHSEGLHTFAIGHNWSGSLPSVPGGSSGMGRG